MRRGIAPSQLSYLDTITVVLLLLISDFRLLILSDKAFFVIVTKHATYGFAKIHVGVFNGHDYHPPNL